MVEKKTKNSLLNIHKLSFEQAMSELETIVQTLESGNIALEEAIEIYNRGNILKKYCKSKLDEAKLKVEQIIVDDGGEITIQPVEL